MRQYRGRVGNMIYYVRNGQTYARRVAIPGKKRKREDGERTPKQRAVNTRFATLQSVYSHFARMVSSDIWRIAGRPQGQMAANLFHAANYACYDAEGRMADPAGFRFSEGSLTLPWDIAVERLDNERYRVTWRYEPEWDSVAGSDLLQVGFLDGPDGGYPYPATTVQGTRADGCGEFSIAFERKLMRDIYIYFAREDGTAYSPSRYFRMEEE